MRERSTGSMVLDYLQAIKLALSKIKEQVWEMINVHTSCTRVLNLIRKQSSNDTRIATHREDIKNFSSMFRKYSFDSPSCELNRLSTRLNILAQDITFDEEFLDPQCLSSLCIAEYKPLLTHCNFNLIINNTFYHFPNKKRSNLSIS